jgi:AAHS family 4-hydroxybenzoate transporter-like MFS transporter
MSEHQHLDVQAFLNEHPFSRFQWLVFALCFGIVLLDGFDTGAVGFVAPSLIKQWGVTRPALAPVLSAALIGLACGGLSAGPLADTFGRKMVLVVSVLVFGLGSLAAAFAADLSQLTLLRGLTGIGLGAAMPNAVTLLNEYCPERRKSALTNAMFCGFPLGASLGGMLATGMIPLWGWRSVFLLGGVAPLVLSALLFAFLPESVRYLIARARPHTEIRAVLVRVASISESIVSFRLHETVRASSGKVGLALVLSRGYVVGSVMLWVTYFMGLLIFYALINWLPILLRDSGLRPEQATFISALFPLGGIGAVVSGWLMDRWNANRIVAVLYALTAMAVYTVGQAGNQVGLLVLTVFVAGALMNTAQSSLGSLAASFYPTAGRATGVAWMMGVGRLGGIFGSFLVAELTRRQLSFGMIFAIVSIAGLLACLALVIKQLANPEPVAGQVLATGHAAE